MEPNTTDDTPTCTQVTKRGRKVRRPQWFIEATSGWVFSYFYYCITAFTSNRVASHWGGGGVAASYVNGYATAIPGLSMPSMISMLISLVMSLSYPFLHPYDNYISFCFSDLYPSISLTSSCFRPASTPYFFKKYIYIWKNGRNRTLLGCLKNQYIKNETFIFIKYQNSLKTKVPRPLKMPPSELPVMPPFDFLAKLEQKQKTEANGSYLFKSFDHFIEKYRMMGCSRFK